MTAATELSCPPRYGTRRSPDRPTLGPQVARIAAQLGKPFLPHQKMICDVALEIDPNTGYLAYDEVIVIGPRQVTGKTELMLPVMTHRCTGFGDSLARWVKTELGITVPKPGPQRVLYTTQTAEEARKKWVDIHVARLEESVFKSKINVRRRLAAEAIRWPNGSSWSPGSTTGKTAGTGDTLDLGVIDEAWSRDDARTELGLRPAMMTRPWRQLWALSMLPGISRALPGKWPYLHQKRQNGRARCEHDIRERVAYFEWSAALDMDPADPATWWSCMPALGHTVQERTVRSDFESLGLVDFCAEYLGWEPDPAMARWLVVSEGTWRALEVPNLTGRQPYVDPVAFAVDAPPDQSSATIAQAALTLDGDTFVEVVERQPGIVWAIEALVKLADHHGPCGIGIAAHGPCAPLIEPLRRALLAANVDAQVITFQGPEVSKACGQFYAETGQVGEQQADPDVFPRRIAHINQPELNAAVAGAEKYTFADQWRWARNAGSAPLYAATLARAAGESVEWLGGSYNVSDSLG